MSVKEPLGSMDRSPAGKLTKAPRTLQRCELSAGGTACASGSRHARVPGGLLALAVTVADEGELDGVPAGPALTAGPQAETTTSPTRSNRFTTIRTAGAASRY